MVGFVEHRGQLVFLFLILAQGAHSIEEYATRLYEVFAPARFVSGLISNDLALGFLIFNGCAGHVRFVVLGYSGTLRLARSPRLSLVLDNSGVGQWHRPHGYGAVARGLLPWRGDRSAAAVVRCVAGDSPGLTTWHGRLAHHPTSH